MAARRKGLLLSGWVFSALVSCFLRGVTGDVPDDVVYTDLHKTVRIGGSVNLTCQFRGTPLAVYWKKGDDPRTAPNLVSWIPTDEVTGLCEGERPCQIMEMNENRSLVIKEVSIAEEGRYICRVSSYKGILIHNFTDIKLFSPPQDPFPVIHQCAEREPSASQSCSISTSTHINVTCLASRYYPDIELFFLHGHNKITNLVTNEWTNHDGTKNKFISMKGSSSKTPYVCVASNIPGSKEQKVATILLVLPAVYTSVASGGLSSLPMTTMEAAVTAYTARPAKIVVPIVILVIIVVVGITFLWWKRHQRNSTPKYKDDEESIPMVQNMKVHVVGIVSFYELWLLAYYTPKDDLGKVCAALIKLGMTDIEGQMRREQVYDALCGWKQSTKTPEQAQMLRDALEEMDLGTRWQQIYDKRRQAITKVPEGTLEQILRELEEPETIHKFIRKLIPDAEIMVDTNAELNAVDPDASSSRDNGKGKNEVESETDVHVAGMRKLREWSKGPFTQNPFVLVSLALEGAAFFHISKTFFEGTVSFYELRSLLYDMDTPILEKVRKTVRELGMEEEVKGSLGPQQLYEALCGWKEKHNRVDQAKILRDALERADFEEAWLNILEQRKNNSTTVPEGTLKQILLEVGDPIKVQQILGRLVPGSARNVKASAETDVIHQAMETLKEWNKGPFDENPIVLLCRALEMSGCNPEDRTFFYGTLSYFELWSMVNSHLEDNEDTSGLRRALMALDIPDTYETTTKNQLYLLLCKWKEDHPNFDQLLALKVHLIEAGLNNVWQDISDRRYGKDRTISDSILEHILRQVRDPNKINNFLQKLFQSHLETSGMYSRPGKDFIQTAHAKLKEWKKGPFIDEHPIVLLTLALERAKCHPVDRTFFRVPTHLQKPIQLEEVKIFVRKLTSRHGKRLANALPHIGQKSLFNISDENNKILFDTQSLMCDWIANKECSNYEKRCQLDDVLINIGRHDMTGCFGTTEFRRKTEDLSTNVHPMSKRFNPETIFDDDLIRLKKLMDCLNLDMMSTFSKAVNYDVIGETTKSPGDQELRRWRDSRLTSKSKGVFSTITDIMGDRTCDYIMDEELEYLALQVKDDGTGNKLVSALNINRDMKDGQTKKKTERTSIKVIRQVSDEPGEQTKHADDELTSREKQHNETSSLQIEKGEEVELTLVDVLKVWRNKQRDVSCRRTLRAALKSIGIEECIVNETPWNYMYEAELVLVAFNILMRDVYPVIEALGIDQRKVRQYRKRVPGLDKGSVGLLLPLCPGTNNLEPYNRLDFCLLLTKLGYVDVARSTYLDYEQCVSELSSIASCLRTYEFQSFIHHLDMSPEELTECHGPDGEVDRLEALRMWRTTIRPPPFHYRLKIVNGLIAIGRRELAGDVLNGFHRRKDAEENVIKGICNRLDDIQIKDLCGLLQIKPGEDRKRSTTKVLNWVDTWMDKYDPIPKAGITPDKFQQRKQQNNELAQAGFYELANEIMILEYSR